jgi:hypothetical protein
MTVGRRPDGLLHGARPMGVMDAPIALIFDHEKYRPKSNE